ncbi:MAG: hypothetical protein ACTS27_00140 [Phycisphaerales bacterium]
MSHKTYEELDREMQEHARRFGREMLALSPVLGDVLKIVAWIAFGLFLWLPGCVVATLLLLGNGVRTVPKVGVALAAAGMFYLASIEQTLAGDALFLMAVALVVKALFDWIYAAVRRSRSVEPSSFVGDSILSPFGFRSKILTFFFAIFAGAAVWATEFGDHVGPILVLGSFACMCVMVGADVRAHESTIRETDASARMTGESERRLATARKDRVSGHRVELGPGVSDAERRRPR